MGELATDNRTEELGSKVLITPTQDLPISFTANDSSSKLLVKDPGLTIDLTRPVETVQLDPAIVSKPGGIEQPSASLAEQLRSIPGGQQLLDGIVRSAKITRPIAELPVESQKIEKADPALQRQELLEKFQEGVGVVGYLSPASSIALNAIYFDKLPVIGSLFGSDETRKELVDKMAAVQLADAQKAQEQRDKLLAASDDQMRILGADIAGVASSGVVALGISRAAGVLPPAMRIPMYGLALSFGVPVNNYFAGRELLDSKGALEHTVATLSTAAAVTAFRYLPANQAISGETLGKLGLSADSKVLGADLGQTVHKHLVDEAEKKIQNIKAGPVASALYSIGIGIFSPGAGSLLGAQAMAEGGLTFRVGAQGFDAFTNHSFQRAFDAATTRLNPLTYMPFRSYVNAEGLTRFELAGYGGQRSAQQLARDLEPARLGEVFADSAHPALGPLNEFKARAFAGRLVPTLGLAYGFGAVNEAAHSYTKSNAENFSLDWSDLNNAGLKTAMIAGTVLTFTPRAIEKYAGAAGLMWSPAALSASETWGEAKMYDLYSSAAVESQKKSVELK